MEWLMKIAASGILGVFGDSIVKPLISAYLKAKDVDLEKFKQTDLSTTQLATAILDANVKFAEIKSGLITTVLGWWPFRLVLFLLIATATARFMVASFDSTWWWIFGCTAHNVKGVIDGTRIYGDACSWSIPEIHGTFGDAEKEFLFFFIVAKPVDTAVTGALGLISRYLNKR